MAHMSRVIKKLAEGGTSEQKKLFEWAGSKYDKDALKNAYAKKYQSEINSGKYSKRELQLLDEGFKQVVSAIDSDDFGRDISGEWNNTAGVSSTGFADKNIFGRLKKTDNNSVSLAASILNDTFSNLSPYSEPAEETPKKEQFDLNLRSRLQKRLMPGEKGWNQNVWSDLEKGQRDESGKLLTTGRQQAIRDSLLGLAEDLENPENKDKYQYQDFIKDPSEYAKQVRSLVGDGSTKGLLGDVIGDAGDLSVLSKLGITGFEGLFQEEEAEDPNAPANETPEQKAERVKLETDEADWTNFLKGVRKGDQSKQWGVLLDRKDVPNVPTKKSPTELFLAGVPNPFKSTMENPVLYEQSYDFNSGVGNKPGEEHKKSIETYIKDWMEKSPDVKDFTEGDYIYIPDTLTDDNYVLRYNTRTNAVQKVLASESQSMIKYIKDLFMKQRDPNIANRTDEFAKGGILKFQFGNAVRQQRASLYKDTAQKAKQEETRKAQVAATKQQAPEQSSKTEEETKISQEANRKPSDGWEWDDYTRLGAIGSDLVGLVAGFVPGGSVVSAGSGFLSTGANFAADMKDGFQWSDAGNAAMGLGMDVLSVIPGLGIAAKGSKIAKNLIKWTPRLLAAWGAMNNAGPAAQSLIKLKDKGWNSLTVDDWRNISNGIHLVVSGGRGVKRQVQAKNLAKSLETGNMQVRTNQGFATLSPEQLSNLKGQKGLPAQNEYLKQLGIEGNLETKFGGKWFNPTRNFNNPQVIKEYNFDKPKTKMTSAGEVIVNRTPTEKMIMSNMQKNLPTVPNLVPKNIETKINDIRYRGARKAAEAKPNMNKIRVKYVKENPQYSKLTDKELLEQVKDQLNPAVWKKAVDEVVWGVSELKLGGILKGQGGLVMNRETVPAPNPYLTVPNTEANARNQELWGKYYDINKAMSDMGTNKWTSGTTVGGLNSLYALRGQVPTNLNQRGALNFNTSFDTNLGILNTKVFGKDTNRFDYMGPSTYNRKALLDKMALTYNSPENTIETADGKAYFNGTRWTTLPIQTRTITQPLQSKTPELALVSKPTQSTPQQSGKTPFSGLRPMTKQGSQFLPEDAIALGRMVGTMGVNNWANRRIQSAMRPTLIDTYENYIPQTEDYLAKTSAYNNAAEIQRQAGRIAAGTSDASLGAAAMLEGTRQGSQIRLQGDLANSQRLYQTGEQGRAESNAAKARRVEVANRNKAAMNQVDLAKAQMDAQTRVGNWMQAMQPWAAGIENRLRTNRGIQRQLDMQANEIASQRGTYQSKLNLLKEFQGKDMSNPAVQMELQTRMMELENEASRSALENTATTIGRGVFFKRPLTENSLFGNQRPKYAARGSKLTARDMGLIERAKDFNKAMRDQQKNFLKELQSVRREHSQMMRQLSSFTADLIKSGMSWK